MVVINNALVIVGRKTIKLSVFYDTRRAPARAVSFRTGNYPVRYARGTRSPRPSSRTRSPACIAHTSRRALRRCSTHRLRNALARHREQTRARAPALLSISRGPRRRRVDDAAATPERTGIIRARRTSRYNYRGETRNASVHTGRRVIGRAFSRFLIASFFGGTR